ncbi:MAG TPA: ANTAR domain-containing protein [Gaiellaceae bacterium]|nr:ANTAR domain-containing protein [Gaiellaceae bacterium]
MTEPDLHDVDAWRERAEQLQGALDSRVVIEQAKGVLRERLGLPLESAFQLLRTAARNSGRKLHDVADDVVDSFSTPEPIVQALGRHPEFMTMSREERIEQTEEFFRQVNDAIASHATRDGQPYMCECANPYCNATMNVTKEDLEVLHSVPGYYLVLPGHEFPDVERIVHGTPAYTIVAKNNLVRSP